MTGSTAASAAEYEFKLHHFLSPKAPAHRLMLEPWAQSIMDASGGRIAIEIFPSMSLGGKPPQLPRQVRDGVVDIAWIVNAYAAGQFPRTEVFELPGVHQGSSAAVNMAMETMYDGELAKDFKGVVPLFQHVHGGQAIHMADAMVRSPADLAGKKIRIPSRTGSWVVEALGANPVKTSVGEIPAALAKKVVDGALIPFEIIPPLKIHEQTKYQIEGPGGKRLGTTSFSVVINEQRWNGLPDDIRKVFEDASGRDWHAKVGDIWDGADNVRHQDGDRQRQRARPALRTGVGRVRGGRGSGRRALDRRDEREGHRRAGALRPGGGAGVEEHDVQLATVPWSADDDARSWAAGPQLFPRMRRLRSQGTPRLAERQ